VGRESGGDSGPDLVARHPLPVANKKVSATGGGSFGAKELVAKLLFQRADVV